MKMTLSSPNNSTNEKLTTPTSEKQPSPNTSPRASPRPSPRPQPKREHPKTELLTVNYKDTQSGKHDGSPSSQEGSISSRISNLEISPISDQNKQESSGSSTKDRKETRSKKKSSSWFFPTYKSKSGDFKRLFKDVPDDERLVVDYSCALQKEILVQGRLYATQNYLCFYANIFGWETTVVLKWKEVSAITKEKTARVIPNAVLICTRQEKYFFTSFVSREKTYLMLFRVWQNALMDQQMTPQEMWQWVHQCYGDELGLTSDDEDYIAPGTEEDKLSARLSAESFSEHECSGAILDSLPDTMVVEETKPPDDENSITKSTTNGKQPSASHIPTDLTDTDSDAEKQSKTSFPYFLSWENSLPIYLSTPDSDERVPVLQSSKCDTNVQCTSSHDGRLIMDEVIPIHIDQLFTLLFTSSKFYLDFHASRKTTDLTQTPWIHNDSDNSKSRAVHLTVALNQTMGPKTAQVTETQVMLPCSKAGCLYAIDVDTVNAGIPYADSFTIVVHHCLRKVSENETSYRVWAQAKTAETNIRGMIEKTCWSGLEDFYNSLSKALHLEGEENVSDVKRKSRRKRRIHSMPRAGAEDSSRPLIGANSRMKISSGGIFSSDVATMIVFIVLILLVILNVMLYFKLWSLEESPPYTLMDLHVLKDPPKSHDEWIKLLQQQETLHSVEIQKWQRILKTAIQLLKQTEESLNELQRSISPTYTKKVMSILQNHKDAAEQTRQEEL